MPYVVQSPMPQLAERVALPNDRKVVWGIRLPSGGRRASPNALYNWQDACNGKRADFPRLYTPYLRFWFNMSPYIRLRTRNKNVFKRFKAFSPSLCTANTLVCFLSPTGFLIRLSGSFDLRSSGMRAMPLEWRVAVKGIAFRISLLASDCRCLNVSGEQV